MNTDTIPEAENLASDLASKSIAFSATYLYSVISPFPVFSAGRSEVVSRLVNVHG